MMNRLGQRSMRRPSTALITWPARAFGVAELIALVLAGLALACDVVGLRHSSSSIGANPFYVFAGALAFLAMPIGAFAVSLRKTRIGSAITGAITAGAAVGAIVIPIVAG